MAKKENKTPEQEPVQAEEVGTAEEIIEEVKAEAEAAKAEQAQPDAAEKLKGQLAEANDKYLRLCAEYDNFRRRSRTERENIYADVRSDTVKKFLPVYDNLLRAVQHETDEEEKKGAQAILTQFDAILDGFGVKAIDAVGKKFDPALHNAVLHIEDEKYGEGEIVLELEKGFTMGDKVIRFACVQVAN